MWNDIIYLDEGKLLEKHFYLRFLRVLLAVFVFPIFSVVADNFRVVLLYVFFHYEKIITLKHDDGRRD